MLAPGTERLGWAHYGGGWLNVFNAGAKSNSPIDPLRKSHQTYLGSREILPFA